MKRTVVIMAGGSGERFWPLSRINKPKQLLSLTSDKTMLQEAIDRISPLIPPEDIFIITSKVLIEPIRDTLPAFPPENVIAEPFKRNTAPCLALSAAFIAEKYKETNNTDEISVAVLTADHIIKPAEAFIRTIDYTLGYVEQHPVISTIGIPPARPETGYGYIETETAFSGETDTPEIKSVLRFHEKPGIDLAVKYVNEGRYLWNSGMFFWRLDTFINAMVACLPEIGNKISEMAERYRGEVNISITGPNERISDIFERFPDVSIDYGLMEKAGNVVVTKALFQWDDIGSWDSLDRLEDSDSYGNIIQGFTSLVDCKNSIFINKSTGKELAFAGIGLDEMVVILTDDAVLVCPKNRVQDVKKCVGDIRNRNGEKWL